MTGSRLGKYEILSKLGEGGMGEVWLARDEQLHRNVALKILPPEVARDPGRRARFEQEARALAALNHPNIVAVYEFGESEGRVYLVSELVEGESLRALLDRARPPARRAIEIGVQIADAIAAAHAAGIVHRDLKPENVMLTNAGVVKVLDFGLAKQTHTKSSDATVTMALTQPGTVMGTVGYMSPEQVRGLNTDHRSDIFSFGVILFEMFSGKRPFEGESSVEAMNAILHADLPELPEDAPAISPQAMSVIRRCLEKRPEQRFQSAADLAFALRSLSGATTFTTNAPGVTISGAQPVAQIASRPVSVAPQPQPKRRGWIWPVAAVVAGAALFAGGFFLRDRTLHNDPPQFQRLTFRRGFVSNARFAPDGKSVVYAASWDGAPQHIYLAIPGDPESRDLGLPEGSKLLAVSANSEVAFSHPPFTPDGAGTLARSSISGGQMRPWLEGVLAADWTLDGSSLAVLRTVDGKSRLEYPVGKVLVNYRTYPPFAIRFSPDGSRLGYAMYTGNGSRVGVGYYDSAGKDHPLGIVSGQTNYIDASLSWSPDDRELWFRSFDANEWNTIYAVDLNGHRRVVTRVPEHAAIFDISRDGRALMRTDSSPDGIMAKGPGDTAERDLSILDSSDLTGISDDGSIIAASVNGEGGGPKGSVYSRKLDGSPPVRLGDGHAFVLAPDGKWVAGYSSPDGVNRSFRLLPTGAGEERVLDIPGLQVGVPFGSLGAAGQYAVVGYPKGKDYPKSWRCFFWDERSNVLRPICPEGIPDDMIYASPDHKWILSQAPGGGHLTAYPVDGGDPKPVAGMAPDEIPLGWRSDSQSIYVTSNTRIRKTLSVSTLNITTGKRAPWMEIHPSRAVDTVVNPAITPDGRAYAYNYVVSSSDLYLASGLK